MKNWLHSEKEWNWVLSKAQEGQVIFASESEQDFVERQLSVKGLKVKEITEEHSGIYKLTL